MLIYDYMPAASGATDQTYPVTLAGPANARLVSHINITAHENNILTPWQNLGSPAYPTRDQLHMLREINQLNPATMAATTQDGIINFAAPQAGVSLLQWSVER